LLLFDFQAPLAVFGSPLLGGILLELVRKHDPVDTLREMGKCEEDAEKLPKLPTE
jgi:hypothetical protein